MGLLAIPACKTTVGLYAGMHVKVQRVHFVLMTHCSSGTGEVWERTFFPEILPWVMMTCLRKNDQTAHTRTALMGSTQDGKMLHVAAQGSR